MSWLITLLEANNGAIIAFSALITAIATGVLAVITYCYAKTTRGILKASNKPEILIFLFPDETYPSCINLCIQNIGTGFAHKIYFAGDFSFTPMLPHGWKPLAENGILKNGIDYLPPGKKVEIFLFMTNTMEQSFSHDMLTISEESLDITVTYRDSVNAEHEKNFQLEFNQWGRYGLSENNPVADIADTLKVRIAEDLSEIKRILEYTFEKKN